MIYTDLTKKAMRLAFKAHEGQLDRANLPYVNHPLHIAEQMNDEYLTCVALLHDTVEDSKGLVTINRLKKLGFPDKVVEAVELLTHKDNVNYIDYIKNLSKNELARIVKIADLEHNMDMTRLPEGKTLKKYELYEKALNYLRLQ